MADTRFLLDVFNACRLPVILRRAAGETWGPGNHKRRRRLPGGPGKPGHDKRGFSRLCHASDALGWLLLT
jgi:hypothetical protein